MPFSFFAANQVPEIDVEHTKYTSLYRNHGQICCSVLKCNSNTFCFLETQSAGDIIMNIFVRFYYIILFRREHYESAASSCDN